MPLKTSNPGSGRLACAFGGIRATGLVSCWVLDCAGGADGTNGTDGAVGAFWADERLMTGAVIVLLANSMDLFGVLFEISIFILFYILERYKKKRVFTHALHDLSDHAVLIIERGRCVLAHCIDSVADWSHGKNDDEPR